LDPQAAIGRQQLQKLPAFIDARRRNWETLRASLEDLESVFDFTLPTHATRWVPAGQRIGAQEFAGAFEWSGTTHRTAASWFGFMLRVRPSASFSHTDLARHLDQKKIGNRMFFGGNLVRQPVFVQLRKDRPQAFRVLGDMHGADEIMNGALFLGTYPGLTAEMLDYEAQCIRNFTATGGV